MDDKEFQKFLMSYDNPRLGLQEKILKAEKSRLSKEYRNVLAKVLGIHALAGGLTLAACPQFGWSPFEAPEHLPHLFMSYGIWACGMFCGSVFMGAGTLLKMLLLKNLDQKVYQRKLWIHSSAISFFFMVALMLAGKGEAAQSAYLTLTFTAFWFIGALLFESLPNLLIRRRPLRL